MELIFTSFGFNSPIVSEKLQRCINPAGKSVIVLPFAGFNEESTFLREKQGLVQFGFADECISLCDKSNFAQFSKVDYIYVPGGDTFKLLSYVKTNGMMEHIRHLVAEGAVYIGASAGAVLATSDLEYVTAVEDNNFSLCDFTGLGLCNNVIVPHFDQMSHSSINSCRVLSDSSRRMLYIKNCDAVVMHGSDAASIDYLISPTAPYFSKSTD